MKMIPPQAPEHEPDLPSSLVITCNEKEKILNWDCSSEKKFGWIKKEMLGRPLHDIIVSRSPRSRKESLAEILRRRRRTGSTSVKLQEILKCRDGSALPVEMVVTDVHGQNSYVINIIEVASAATTKDGVVEAYNTILNTILTISLKPHPLHERLEQILDYILSIEQLNLLPRAAIFLADEEARTLYLKANNGFSPLQAESCHAIPFGSCSCGLAAQTAQLQFGVNIASPCHALFKDVSPNNHFCIPICGDTQVVGVMSLHVSDGYIRTPGEDSLFSAIANVLAVIIDNQNMDLQLIHLVNDLRNSIVELREEKKFSDSIIQGLKQGLVVADLSGTIQKYNSVAETLLGHFTSSITGKTLIDIIGKKATEEMTEVNGLSCEHPEKELTLTTEAGEQKIISVSTVPRENAHGEQVGFITSLNDVTEVKYVHQEMEKMNRVSTVAEIASAVAHEVRNPLAGIKIMAQSIEEDTGGRDERIECSQRIIKQVDRLNALLSEFFSYARPATPEKTTLSLIDIFSETKPLIKNKLFNKNITLKEQYDKKLPLVLGDPNHIQQVFLNLILNSIDAITTGGIIEIDCRKMTKKSRSTYKKNSPGLLDDSPYVIVKFIDNGIGMSQGVADKIFEPFFTTKTTGAGLGLSIVHRTLQENDARIIVDSTENMGTTFTLFFKTAPTTPPHSPFAL